MKSHERGQTKINESEISTEIKRNHSFMRPQKVAVFTLLVVGAVAVFHTETPLHAAWSDPTDLPPGGNVSAPLNVSGVTQTKAGQIVVQSPTTPFSLKGIAPGGKIAATPTIFGSAGIFGVGANPETVGQTAGVYGVAYEGSDGDVAELRVGLMGVAPVDLPNTVGVYGWDGTTKGTASTSYAGYFVGRLAVKGALCFVDPDNPDNVDCKSSWDQVGGGTQLFTESPANNTYLNNASSNLSIGGHDESNAAFFFDASSAVGTDKGILHTNGGLVIGPAIVAGANNGICEPPTEDCSDADCFGKQLSCPSGKVCNPNGTGSCIVADNTAPSVPNGLSTQSGSVTANSLTLTWNTSTDNNGGSGMQGYYVYRCQNIGNSDCTNFVKVTNSLQPTSQYADSGLNASTTYRYEVSAVDNFGNTSVQSAPFNVTTQVLDTVPPSVPTGLQATGISSAEIDLTWNASTDNNGGTGVGGYDLYRCAGTSCSTMSLIKVLDNPTVIGGSITYADTGLASNSTYRYQIDAYDKALPAHNKSSRTGLVSGATLQDLLPPNPPTGVSNNGTVYANFVPIKWAASASTDVTKYYVYRCVGNPPCSYSAIGNVDGQTLAYDDRATSASTTYTYIVRAYDGANYSVDSNAYTVTTNTNVRDNTPPAPNPLTLSKIADDVNKVKLSWNAATDSGSGLAGYKIHRCDGGATCDPRGAVGNANGYNVTESVLNSATTTLDDIAPFGRTYGYTVLAYDNNGNATGWSNVVYGTPTQGNKGGDQNLQGLSTPPNAHIASLKPVTTTVRPLARVFSSSLTASLQRTLLPVAQAAGVFGGNTNVRLTVNNGVIQILNKVGAVTNTLEIGNNGSDIASTDVINIRPNGITTGTNYGIFSKNAQNKTDLSLGSLQLQALSGAPSTTPSNGTIYYDSGTNKFKCYQNNAWVDCVGGGSISGTQNYIPKFATSTTLGNSLLYDNGTSVGISTATPNADYKLDVNGAINTVPNGSNGYCINGSCISSWSNLILNTAPGQPFAGTHQGASFDIDSTGKIGKTLEVDDTLGIRVTPPASTTAVLEVKSPNADDSGLKLTNLTQSGSGKVLSVDSTGKVVLVNDQSITGVTSLSSGSGIALSPATITATGTVALNTSSIGSCTNGTTSKIIWDSAGTGKLICATDQTSSGLGGYNTIRDESTDLAQRTKLQFTGAGVTCSDDNGNTLTKCDIPATGSDAFTVKSTIGDTTANYLGTELAVGTGLTLTNPGSGDVKTQIGLDANGGGPYWALSGNAIGSNDFIGGTPGNTNPFIVKTNGTEALRVLNGGNVGIGQTGPQGKLVVNNGLSGTGSSGDAIASYANTTNAAVYAQQNNVKGYAGFFSGNVVVEGAVPSSNRSAVGLESNMLFNATNRHTVTQSGPANVDLATLFDGRFGPTYSATGNESLSNPQVITIDNLGGIDTQAGSWFGWTTRYWAPLGFKVEMCDQPVSSCSSWYPVADYSTTDYNKSEFITALPSGDHYVQAIRLSVYKGSGQGADTNRFGLSEVYFIHPEANRLYAGLLPQNLWEGANGNVGIGQANPQKTLDVNGAVRLESFTSCGALTTNGSGDVACGNGSSLSGSGAANRVTIWTGANALSYNNNLVWDNANSRLGIGTTTPNGMLQVDNVNAGNNWAYFTNNVGGNNPANVTGLAIGWNKSNQDGESNLVYNIGAGGTSNRLAIGSYSTTNGYREELTVKSGNIGISNDSPISPLTVYSSGTPYNSAANTASVYNNSASAVNAFAGYKSGSNVQGSGVYGELTSGGSCSGTCAAIYGSDSFNSANSYAGYFNGKVRITGNLDQINGASYSWPSAHASGVLTSDANGNLTWTPISTAAEDPGSHISYWTDNGTESGVYGVLPWSLVFQTADADSSDDGAPNFLTNWACDASDHTNCNSEPGGVGNTYTHFYVGSGTFDSGKRLLGVRLSGSSDDSGACEVRIFQPSPSYLMYFRGAVTNRDYVTGLSYFDTNPSVMISQQTLNKGNMPTGTWMFESTNAAYNLGTQNDAQNNIALNKPVGLTESLPPGLTYRVYQVYHNQVNSSVGGVSCKLEAVYAKNAS